MLSQKDQEELRSKGISETELFKQIEQIKKGIIPQELIRPAVIENGIIVTTEKTRNYYINVFDDYSRDRHIVKFVPASGAASRMFKDLYACIDEMKQSEDSSEEIPSKYLRIRQMIEKLSEMAFYPALKEYFKQKDISLSELLKSKKHKTIIEAILSSEGLNYGNLPKALLHFHNYNTYQRKAIDEHLVEGALYAVNATGNVNIHFTISPEHETMFIDHLKEVLPIYEEKFGITYKVTFSFQHTSTDTPATDDQGNLIREQDGSIVFRPAGHGALLKNLNDLDGDLIFIKNIDNVTTDKLRSPTIEYKKVLAGILIEKEITINGNLSLLMDDSCSPEEIYEIAAFVKNDMMVSLPDDFFEMDIDKQRRILTNKLNRPIRVCGMVKNEGEPGGGPFFVKNPKGITSLQIVENAQINMNDPLQTQILRGSTHFNPVDIVAGIIDFLGRKFDLNDFVDPETYIVSEKSKDGKPLKALELPGLWNGAMAGWITYFVEVPLETFTPVKEIFDLLRPQHLV